MADFSFPPPWEDLKLKFHASFFRNLPLLELGAALLAFLQCRYFIRSRRMRCPMMWPLLGMLPSLLLNMHRIYDWLTTILLDCGGSFRYLGPWLTDMGFFVTCKPENVEYILRTHFDNFPKGERVRGPLHDLFGEGIFNADHEQWRLQRKRASIELHSLRSRRFNEETVKRLVQEKLIPVLTHASKTGLFIDLQDVLLRYTFDNICISTVGVDPCYLSIGLPEVPFARALDKATELITLRFITPGFIWKGLRALNLGQERQLREAIQLVDQCAAELIAARKRKLPSGNSQTGDLLSCFLEMENSNNKMVRDVMINFIIAGRDTSAIALSWFFWLLSKNPEAEGRILQEISGVEKRGESFSKEELKGMHYLHAAMSETLRLHPSVPLEVKEVVEDTELPDGSKLKAGEGVVLSIYTMGRMERIWGEDWMRFRPERWLREGRFVDESTFKYTVFNGGPRLCLGKEIAYMQMKAAAASILERFEVRVKSDHIIKPRFALLHFMKYGLHVTLVPRPPTPKP